MTAEEIANRIACIIHPQPDMSGRQINRLHGGQRRHVEDLSNDIAATLAERDAEIARLSALTRVDTARDFPTNTCPASRHAQMIGEELVKGEADAMLTEDPRHLGESILATVAALWETRAERDTLRAEVERLNQALFDDCDPRTWRNRATAAEDALATREAECRAAVAEECAQIVEAEGRRWGASAVSRDATALAASQIRALARAALTNRTEGGDDAGK